MRTIAVIGSGTMGSGIAQKIAQENMEVILCDVSAQALERGMNMIHQFLEEGVQRRIFNSDQAKGIESRIRPTPRVEDAAAAELIIEAVFEDLHVKHDLFRKLDAVCLPTTILASNTSSLLVTELAKATKHPERFGGLHYFYHPAKNRLVEIIPGERTSLETVHRMIQFNKQLGKVSIVCQDRPGFVVNRFFVPWLNEAVYLLEEGVGNIPTIEAIAKSTFSIGMGPFELMNVTGIPIAHHALAAMEKEMGSFYRPARALSLQMDKKALWDLSGIPNIGAQDDKISNRLLGVVFGLVCQIVDEKVCSREDVDRGAKVGLRWAAGPFELMNRIGISASQAMVDYVASKHSEFSVPASLRHQASLDHPWKLTTVDLTITRGTATITLNRPEALNAINESLMKDLDEAVTKANADPSVRVIVLEGAGKAFGAGADIRFFVKAMEEKRVPDIVSFTAYGHEVLRKIDESPKLVIAKIHGPAIGGGAEIALAADVLVAADKAVIGFPETGLGIYPGLGGTQRLPRRVGKELGQYLIFLGDMLNAKKAWEIGLIDEVTTIDKLDEVVMAIANGAKAKKSQIIPEWAEEMKKAFADEKALALIQGQPVLNGIKQETLEAISKKLGRKSSFALKAAHRLIQEGLKLPLSGGLELELDSLTSVFTNPDAYERFSKVK